MDQKKEIVGLIEKMSGKYSPYMIFSDWIKMASISIQNVCCLFHDSIWQQREQMYLDTVSRYTEDEQLIFCRMNALLVEAFEERIGDILGEIYMEAGCGNKNTGQFFTPFHISELTSNLAIQNLITSFDGKMIKLNEPSSGGGGMIIGTAKALKEAGIDYQRYLQVIAQDLDWNGVYMTYLQLSLLGIDALVVQGDTLMEPYQKGYPEERVLRTPRHMGVLI